jgi:hypothetical protein
MENIGASVVVSFSFVKIKFISELQLGSQRSVIIIAIIVVTVVGNDLDFSQIRVVLR